MIYKTYESLFAQTLRKIREERERRNVTIVTTPGNRHVDDATIAADKFASRFEKREDAC